MKRNFFAAAVRALAVVVGMSVWCVSIQAAADDFKEFQEARITHPDMEKIKALLTKSEQ